MLTLKVSHLNSFCIGDDVSVGYQKTARADKEAGTATLNCLWHEYVTHAE